MPTRGRRVAGAVLGSAVGDALGAPFEFGAPRAFSERFPADATMCGGGGWEPGEATDDTQLAVLVGLSLVECGGLDPADMFARFRAWARSEPKDIGLQTEQVLTNGLPWDRAAAAHAATHRRAAGNGSLMRATTSAVYFARAGRQSTMDAARVISGLTHGDPSAGEGCAVYHELIRVGLAGGDLLDAVPGTLSLIKKEHRGRWAAVLDRDWHPDLATESDGAVWPTLGSALWALRTTGDFADALRAAIDLGGDTDTVAAVTGGLAGVAYGLDAIPERWLAPLHVEIPGRVLRAGDLRRLAERLDTPANEVPGTYTGHA
ncbi:ribosylglycohydrolase [Virgisporangium aliadipatigenens]|uniref:Ribosylglycohydrolase n=1 Tax=Virgisporangium aliadipatigenens TaxID=741659 RepID=A0A8J4DMW5_9ACTN|nr:ADP-ribosylglycohydrolase family protein [Virgisporangium aliadipatigenens]GIJ43794.1 ribosylglycohydrolase [Virgisporangium aliadipatigenens]